jgi:predicted transcriptional regulator
VKKIVGSFAVKTIFEDDPKSLWSKFGDFSGLNEHEFFDYFNGIKKGFAIEIKDVQTFSPFNPKAVIPNFHPPQSYCYLRHEVNLSD